MLVFMSVIPGEAYLIDSGTDDKEAQAIYKLLEQKKWKLTAVILTHGMRIMPAAVRFCRK